MWYGREDKTGYFESGNKPIERIIRSCQSLG